MALRRLLSIVLDRTKAESEGKTSLRRGKAALAVLALISLVIGIFSLAWLRSPAPQKQPGARKIAVLDSSSQPLPDAEVAGMSSVKLTTYIFAHRGCNSCHTLSPNLKLGFTDQGKHLAKDFEGCASMLDAMFVIAQVPPAYRTDDGKEKAARFEAFGCATCHKIGPGTIALTDYGTKLKPLHLNCITRPLCCAPKKLRG